MSENNLETKANHLKNELKKLNNFVVAYSGGTDSTFLAVMAKEAVGSTNFVAVTAKAPIFSELELTESSNLAKDFAINHHVFNVNVLDYESFVENPPNRCYYCKKVIAMEINKIAQEYGYSYVMDGTNHDDVSRDIRPGVKAAKEMNILSPLKDVGLTKEEIRKLSRSKNIPNWNKPSNACLASRIPYGSTITTNKLSKIETAENILKEAGIDQVRARCHDEILRIEVPVENFEKILTDKDHIVYKLKELGFKYITLDLEGYRSGSMNN